MHIKKGGWKRTERCPGTRRRSLACALALALAAAAAAAPAAERYEGLAYHRGTDRLAYRETDWLFTRDGIAQRLVLYQCPDGAPFARKWVRDAPSEVAPDFEFDDARDGYREGVRTAQGARQIFVKDGAQARLTVHPLPAQAGGVIDAGFDAYVRSHWRDLAAGDAERIPFLIPDRFKYLEFRIAGARDGVIDGRPVRLLKMSLAAWYGFALPSIELAYDRQGRHLQQYQGIGTIRDASGRNEDVRIEFPADARHEGVPDEEVDRAARMPLAAACRG